MYDSSCLYDEGSVSTCVCIQTISQSCSDITSASDMRALCPRQ